MLGVIPDPAVTLHEVPAGSRGAGSFLLLGTAGLWASFTPHSAKETIDAAVAPNDVRSLGGGGGEGRSSTGAGAIHEFEYEPDSAARALVHEARQP
jgi:hypothetical protein